jgi:hypothetical protein
MLINSIKHSLFCNINIRSDAKIFFYFYGNQRSITGQKNPPPDLVEPNLHLHTVWS